MNRNKTRQILLPALLFLLFVLPLDAAPERTTTDFKLDSGLRVILQNEPGRMLSVLQVCFPGSSLRQNTENAGIEKMLMDVMQKGGEKYARREADAVLEKYAASLSSSVSRDYSIYEMQSATPFFEPVLDVFADGLLRPVLPPDEIELTRARMLAAVRASQDNPDEIAADALNDIFYRGHPYHNDIEGSLQSLPGISREMLLEHHRLMLDNADAFVVAVGDFDAAWLKNLLEKQLEGLKPQTLVYSSMVDFKKQPDYLARVEREQPAWTMIMKFAGPETSSAHYAALKIGMDYFSRRLWEEIRTKRALAYSVYCGTGMNISNFGFCYMSTRHTAEALQVFYDEIDKLRRTPISAEDLEETRAVFTTRYYQGMESASAQASRLVAAVIHFGNYRNFDTFMQTVKALSPEEIRLAADRYLHDFSYAVLGPAGAAEDSAFLRMEQPQDVARSR